MVFRIIRVAAAMMLMSLSVGSSFGQSCAPTCAAPMDPSCAVPPAVCDPNCAAPSGCSQCNQSTGSCYQPQTVNCTPQHRGLFGCGLRPLFSWTKIEVESKEKCCKSQDQCCQPQVAALTYQPVQLQMTAYQPMIATTQFVAAQPMVAAPQFVAAAPQFVSAQPMLTAAPQMIAAQQFVAAPQVAAVQQAQPTVLRVQSAPQAAAQSTDECDLQVLCEKLKTLESRVNELQNKVGSQSDTSDLERRVQQLEESEKLQTDILKEMKVYFEKNKTP